jgi:hypothetical protein
MAIMDITDRFDALAGTAIQAAFFTAHVVARSTITCALMPGRLTTPLHAVPGHVEQGTILSTHMLW